MAKRKIGIGTIEINRKFVSLEEASRYAKRLRQYISYVCKKKKYQANVITVVSNLRKEVSDLRYNTFYVDFYIWNVICEV